MTKTLFFLYDRGLYSNQSLLLFQGFVVVHFMHPCQSTIVSGPKTGPLNNSMRSERAGLLFASRWPNVP